MSSRSPGFFASLFGLGQRERPGGTARSLFPAPAPVAADLPRAALAPAAPPGIVIDPPHLERSPPPPMPADVPPPPPPPTAPIQPLALAAPAPTPDVFAQVAPPPLAAPPLLLAPATPPARQPTTLAGDFSDTLPPPLPLGRKLALALPADEAPPDTFAERSDVGAGSVVVQKPGFWGGQLLRLPVAPPAPPRDPLPLLEGSEPFAHPFPIEWHRRRGTWPATDVACWFASGAIVTGPGHIWLDGRLVTAPEIMPEYVRQVQKIPDEGSRLLEAHSLPLREIAAPCVVLVGHGLHVYGHFVIELLFRVLLVRHALRGTGLPVRWLLDASAPEWLLRILADDLGIPAEDVEFFRAAEERVRLREAILPGLVHRDEGFHPIANALVEEFLESLAPLPAVPPARRLFVARRDFRNPHHTHRECQNEAALLALAAARGFVAVSPEELPWRQQLALFRNAEIIVGTFGSALHTALVSPAGLRLGCLGMPNRTQSQIAALRGHRMAYLTNGFKLEGQFDVPEEAFAGFLDALCPPGEQVRPAATPVALPPVAVAPAPAEARLDAVAIPRPGFGRARLGRYVVAPAAPPPPPGPLLPGTEPFAVASQRALHREPRPAPARDAACYFAQDAVVSGAGLTWLTGTRVAVPELVSRALAALPEPEDAAPTRQIAEPTLTIAGPGVDDPANFVLETLPRLLLARFALHDTGERLHLLLDSAAPAWLERILRDDLGFKEQEVERFAAPEERVLLRQAVLPTLLHRDGGFHPVLNGLLNEALGRLDLPEVPVAPRLLLVRPAAPGAAMDAPRGDCRNEPALLALAGQRYGFVPVELDTLPWREGIARLRAARVVVVAHGVGIQSVLFSGDGVRVASIGARGALPAEIGALRRQRVAYLAEGVPPKGPFTLQEERFAAFLEALCDPDAEAARAA